MKKQIALLLALTLLASLLAGCGTPAASSAASAAEASESVSAAEETPAQEPEPSQEPEEPADAEEVSAAEDASAEEEAPEEVSYDTMAEKYFAMSNETNENYKALQEGVNTVSYPLADGAELSMWRVFSSFIWGGLMESYADAPIMPLVEEATGVHIKFVEVSDSAESEQFNLTIASGDYCDFMSMNRYSGGATTAYEDDIIIDLTDLADEHMPNYMALVDTMDDYTLNSLYTEDGRILEMYTLVSNVISEQGLSYRADWAEEFGIDSIETVDDMYNYLVKVKETYDCKYPIFIDNSATLEGFTGAFGTNGVNLSQTDLGMILDGDTVVSSVTSDDMRRYIGAFHDFYTAGLIKDDFYSESYGPDYINAYVQDDQCAVTSIRGDKFPTMTANAISDTFRFEALAPLVENKGETYQLRMKTIYTGNGSISVTTTCKTPELAMEFMNYFFTYDGYMLANYGEEGVCFEYNEDGLPVYTEFIVHNPDGYNVMNLRNMYTNPVFSMYTNATAVFYTYDETQLGAFDIWNNNGTDERTLPTLTLTTEENAEYANIATTVYTYATEMILKWMIGEAELTDESWNEYVAQCNSMELPRAVEIYQGVYDRMYG